MSAEIDLAMTTKKAPAGTVLADQHREEGRNALITEIFEALAEWEKHRARCYCGACEVLKPALAVWTRIAEEALETVSQETDTEQPRRRRRRTEAA